LHVTDSQTAHCTEQSATRRIRFVFKYVLF